MYEAYGAKHGSSEVDTPYRYTGQRWEENDALDIYYYKARWYDPALGRFLQPDPFVPEAKNPQALNRYSYGLNNPLRYIDPSGHIPVDEVADVVFIVVDLIFIGIDQADIALNGLSPETAAALGVDQAALMADAACALIPYGTGGGTAARVAANGDIVAQAAVKARQVTRVAQAAAKVGAAVVKRIKAQLPESTDDPNLPGTPGQLPDQSATRPPIPEDPSQAPGEGWEWRGKGDVGTSQGSWYNPTTKESLHPDLQHADGIAPHWDWIDPNGAEWRVYLDGTVEAKP